MRSFLQIIAVVCLLTGVISASFASSDSSLTSVIIERGHYLVRTSGCINCHTQDPAQPFAGGKGLQTIAGTFYPPNITMDEINGIGRWSDADFIKALRRGVSPDGSSYYPAFPFSSFTQLSDVDLLAIKAYIGSVPKSSQPRREHDLTFFADLPLVATFWNATDSVEQSRARFNQPRNFMFAVGPFVPFPTLDEAWNRGAYMVEGSLHCTQCHTPRTDHGHLITDKWMGGSEIAPNITPASSSLTANWSFADWNKFLSTGVTPTGGRAVGDMASVISGQTRYLTPQDRAAVIRYLMALLPVN